MSRLGRFYRGEANVDFARWWRVGAVVSVVAVLVSIGALYARGLNLGIEFEGGTSWEYATTESVAEVRAVLEPFGLESAKIQSVGSEAIRVQAETSDGRVAAEVAAALAESAGIQTRDVSTTVVGASWGGAITESAVRALIVFFIVIAGYMAVRLEWRMAVAALVAVLHDIVITIGIYAIFQFLVTPGTVIAILTILGYSLYDTVVVFDRADENGARYASTGRLPYRDVMAISVNQVLVRSINTTVVTLLPVTSMLVVGSVALGAAPLLEFAIALAVGLTVGAYSSVFVAAPMVVLLKEREPRWTQIRQRYETRVAAGRIEEPAEASGAITPRSAASRTGPVEVPESPYGAHPPRPRKPGKGKPKR